MNRGVGLNKDREIFKEGELDPEVRKISEKFNKNLLYSHCAGVAPEVPEEVVRASMLARINTMLLGRTGVQPKVVQMFLEFLNRRIHPILPARGSIGEGDITILAHIGLAMIGEGEVIFDGTRMKASEALEKAGLEALVPFAKDALSILSSNAYSAGMGALVIHDAEQLLETAELVSTLSLEGLNGNVAPLLASVQDIRPYKGQNDSAQRMRQYLQGSYLWQPDENRALQDPLSFRTASQIYGITHDYLEFLKQQILIQLNSSDDNPAVILNISPKEDASEQVKSYYVREDKLFGAVIPTANFEPISWVLGFQALGNSLRHVSSNSVQRMTRLDTEYITGLSRFLSPDKTTIAFGTIQKTYVALDAEIRALSNPVSADAYPVAGGIEDHASNGPLVVERVARIVDNLRYIVGMELMHAAQAIDLRKRNSPNLKLGHITRVVYDAFRKEVPFLDRDRTLTYDIKKCYMFIKYHTNPLIRPNLD